MVRCHVKRLVNVSFGGLFAFILIGALFNMENIIQLGSLRGQLLVDYIGANLLVEYVISKDNHLFLKLTNNGTVKIPRGNWSLFFNHFGGFHSVTVKKSKTIRESGVQLRHLNSGLYALEPIVTGKRRDLFAGLKPNQSLVIQERAQLKTKWYLFTNWYVSGYGLEPRIVQSTYNKRPRIDYLHKFEVWPPEERYVRNDVRDLNRSVKAVIPTPLSVEVGHGGEVRLDKRWSVVYDKDLLNEALFLAEELHINLANSNDPKAMPKRILRLSCKNIVSCLKNTTSSHFAKLNASKRLYLEEGYTISIRHDTIDICGQTSHGIFYGIQSLLSLAANSKDGITLPLSEIIDAPRFEYRGLLCDVARNFIAKYEILNTIKLMAAYKLNKLHLHLTDDEGWRIEIPTLPELTEVGSRRCHDPQEVRCLPPFFGAEPTQDSHKRDYYTVQDYRDILLHAEAHHVQVIPEIDMPGHAHAAVQSMRIRYMHMKRKNAGEESAGRYLLHDSDDTSEGLGATHQVDSVMNPCIDSTYAFIKEIVRTLVMLHRDTQPLKRLHLGGDEVSMAALTSSPACTALTRKSPELEEHLRHYFTRRVVAICRELDVSVQMWEDGYTYVYDRDISNKADFVVNSWLSSGSAYRCANQGYKVVLTHAHKLYLDHPYEADGDEPGLFWAARSSDSRTVFDFMFSAGELASRGDFSKKESCRVLKLADCIELEKPENIIGMQVSLWGEFIHSNENFEYMLFPRLLAFAERAWHMADWETAASETELKELGDADWTDFANTLGYKELPILERMGIRYRLPVPGFRITDNLVEANTEFPGSLLQYSTDGGNTWNAYKEGNPLEKSENLSFSVVSHNLLRRSRIISV